MIEFSFHYHSCFTSDGIGFFFCSIQEELWRFWLLGVNVAQGGGVDLCLEDLPVKVFLDKTLNPHITPGGPVSAVYGSSITISVCVYMGEWDSLL